MIRRTPTRDLHAGQRHLIAQLGVEPMGTGKFILNVIGCFAVLVGVLWLVPLVGEVLR